MLFKELPGGADELEGSEVVSLLLESGDDGSDQSSLDTVGLNHDVGSLCCHLLNYIKVNLIHLLINLIPIKSIQ